MTNAHHRGESPHPGGLTRDLIRSSLAPPGPVALLLLVSTLVDLAGRSAYNPFDGRFREEISLHAVITTLMDADCIESSVVLAVIAELTDDEWARTRIETELRERPPFLPSCLTTLHQTNDGAAWPAARPLVEWIARLLPGAGHEHDSLLAAVGMVDQDESWSMPYNYRPWNIPFHREPLSYKQRQLAELQKAVGGEAALQSLDVEPLPDEAFAWEGIDEAISARVGDVLVLCDRFADSHLDVEYRTAFRRFLARVAVKDAELFRRPAVTAAEEAAAVCWTIGKANNLFSANDSRRILVRDMMGFFSLYGTAAAGGRAMLRAGDFPMQPDVILASASFLVSQRRRQFVNQRDRIDSAWE